MRWLELKIPPAALFLIFAGLIWATSKILPGFSIFIAYNKVIGVGLFMAGVFIGLAGVAEFRKAKTTVDPLKPEDASNIVESGIYKISRNPMYLGLFTGLMGWALYLSNILNILLLICFVIYMNRFQIIPEEKAMTKKFGDDFKRYKKKVRRWI